MKVGWVMGVEVLFHDYPRCMSRIQEATIDSLVGGFARGWTGGGGGSDF